MSMYINGVDVSSISIFDSKHPYNNPDHILTDSNYEAHVRWYSKNKDKIKADMEAKHKTYQEKEKLRLSKMTKEEIEYEEWLNRTIGI